jgi:hypothetical protein
MKLHGWAQKKGLRPAFLLHENQQGNEYALKNPHPVLSRRERGSHPKGMRRPCQGSRIDGSMRML